MTAAGVSRTRPRSRAGLRARAARARLACAGVLACVTRAHAATRELVVEAPSPFKALLEKNLDIERAARLAEADSLDDTEWARLVAAAPAQGRALAQTEGYFRSEVTVAADPADAHRILIKLVPGEPATVGRFTLEFDGELARQAESGDTEGDGPRGAPAREWELQPGQVFRNGNWDGAKAQTLSALRNEGYAAALWTATAAQVDPATNKARLFLVVDTGPRFLAGDIVVEGIERQAERNVRLLAGFGPGTPLTQQRLLDYQDRLQKTGLFDQVAVIYDPDPAQAAHATVTVHVHEQSLQQATVALGYNSQTKARITLEHTDRKVFGLPATAQQQAAVGQARSRSGTSRSPPIRPRASTAGSPAPASAASSRPATWCAPARCASAARRPATRWTARPMCSSSARCSARPRSSAARADRDAGLPLRLRRCARALAEPGQRLAQRRQRGAAHQGLFAVGPGGRGLRRRAGRGSR